MPLYQKIKNLIKQNRYITIDILMSQVMSATNYSYYQRQSNIGQQGDFITSPEISQLFGEIIGLWVIEQWYKIGCPKQTNLVELGPGQGTLMKDLLRVAKLVPEFYQSLQIELLEINPHFIEKQKASLQELNPNTSSQASVSQCNDLMRLPQELKLSCNNDNYKLKYISSIDQISKIPSIIIANEFFDALPIKQYIKYSSLWHEIIVTIDNATDHIKFDKIDISKQLQNYLQQRHPNTNDRAIIEISPQSQDIMSFISKHINQFNGTSLIIDYGYNIDPKNRKSSQYNSTLQAIKNHQYTNILDNLGEADLSSHVDFYALKMIAKDTGIKINHIITQADFLINNGILLRKQNLENKLPKEEAEIINRQIDRLISSSKMGELFKVLQINS